MLMDGMRRSGWAGFGPEPGPLSDTLTALAMLPRHSVRVLLHPGALRGFGNRHSFPLGGCDWQYAGPAPPGPCPSRPQWHFCLQDAVCRGTEACSLSGEKRSFTQSRCSCCEHQALGCILIHPASKQGAAHRNRTAQVQEER